MSSHGTCAEAPGRKSWVENSPEGADVFCRPLPLRQIDWLAEYIARALVALRDPDFGYLTGTTIPFDGGQANLD